MNLREGLMKALKDNGFDKPFEIQQKSIMPLIEG
jgi:superfamily II DNA/RNA helicase